MSDSPEPNRYFSQNIDLAREVSQKLADFMKYLEVLFTMSDVVNPKPHPEPYILAMIELGCKLEEYIIFEDSIVGIEAAKATGAAVCEIRHVNDVNFGLIANILRETE